MWRAFSPGKISSIQIRKFPIRRLIDNFESLELDVLEVVWHVVVPFVNHTVDNSFAILYISPGILLQIVVERVPNLPGIEVCRGKILVTFVFSCKGVLRQFGLRGSTDNDIEWMADTTLIAGGTEDGSDIVGDAVKTTGDKLAGITQINQLGVSDIDLLAYSQGNVSFEFSEEDLQRCECNEFLHNSYSLKSSIISSSVAMVVTPPSLGIWISSKSSTISSSETTSGANGSPCGP